jgi:hypothetical protein
MEILESLVTLLLDPSGPGAQANPTDSYRGLFLLLRTLASGLRLLAETENSTVLDRVRGWDLAGLLRCCAQLELHRRDLSVPGVVLERPQGGFFTSLRALGDAEEPGTTGTDEAVPSDNPRRAGSAGKSLASAVREVSAPLLRCTSSITWSVLQIAADAGAVTSVVATLIPHYRTWLCVPEMDIRADLAEILAAVYRADGGGESIVTALLRPLQHKLAPLESLAASAGSVDKLALRSAAGALRCLGGVASTLGPLSGEATRLRETVMQHVKACLTIDSAASQEFCLLQVVALEVLQAMCTETQSCGETEMMIPLLLPLLAHSDARVAVPALAAYAKLCIVQGEFACTLIFNSISCRITVGVSCMAASLSPSGNILPFWEQIMAPGLRATENQSIKFAWAEAIVAVATLPMPLDAMMSEGSQAEKLKAHVAANSYISVR